MHKAPLDHPSSLEPRYNTKVVVRQTGVPADTFRAWERRYGVPDPYRTPTGDRLYSERDIALVRWLRDQTAKGITARQAIRLLDLGEPSTDTQQEPTTWPVLAAQLDTALMRLDTRAAEAVLAQAFAHYPVPAVCVRLIGPALVTIGAGWHSGTVSVGHEHFATDLLRRKVQALFSAYAIGDGQATVVAACPPGEQHDVGLLILALLLVRRGVRVVYLGGNVPPEGLLPVVEEVGAALVCLSATLPTSMPALHHVAAALGRLPHPPVVVAGGAGVEEGNAVNAGYVHLRGNAEVAADPIVALMMARRSGAADR